jgi:hypothetical protein
MGGGPGIAGGLLDADHVGRDFAGAEPAACCTLRAISCVAEPCSSTALAIAEAISFISLIVEVIPRIAVPHRWTNSGSRQSGRRSVRCLGGLLGQALDLGRHHRKAAPASPARAASIVALSASRLVLRRNVADELDDVADAGRSVVQTLHRRVGAIGLLDGLLCDRRRLRHLPADLGDRTSQLLRRRRNVCTLVEASSVAAATAVA